MVGIGPAVSNSSRLNSLTYLDGRTCWVRRQPSLQRVHDGKRNRIARIERDELSC